MCAFVCVEKERSGNIISRIENRIPLSRKIAI
jgi:hypothetical protein